MNGFENYLKSINENRILFHQLMPVFQKKKDKKRKQNKLIQGRTGRKHEFIFIALVRRIKGWYYLFFHQILSYKKS